MLLKTVYESRPDAGKIIVKSLNEAAVEGPESKVARLEVRRGVRRRGGVPGRPRTGAAGNGGGCRFAEDRAGRRLGDSIVGEGGCEGRRHLAARIWDRRLAQSDRPGHRLRRARRGGRLPRSLHWHESA